MPPAGHEEFLYLTMTGRRSDAPQDIEIWLEH